MHVSLVSTKSGWPVNGSAGEVMAVTFSGWAFVAAFVMVTTCGALLVPTC